MGDAKRNLLSMQDLEKKEIEAILEEASRFKEERSDGILTDVLKGKTVALIFEMPSTRTRVSFETGVHELGGNPISLSVQDLQLSRGETTADTAKTLSKYVHCIVARVAHQDRLMELSEYSTIPVINALSPLEHPCQILADFLTIREHKGELSPLKLAWVGDGNNVCNSLMLGCSLVGMNISLAFPEGYEPPNEIVEQARENAGKSDSEIELLRNPEEAVDGSDIVYTDVFVSMGNEEEREQRLRDFKGYQVTSELLDKAKESVIFMHCLPAHRGKEVSTEVIDGPRSVVFDQAENRLHVQKAILDMVI